MPYNSSWGCVNTFNLKLYKQKFPIPYIAQAYFLDPSQNLHFYGGFPSKDFFISRGDRFTNEHIFSRYLALSYINCNQGASVTVNYSRYFSNLISRKLSDPRLDLVSLTRQSLAHNCLRFYELRLRAFLTNGLFYSIWGSTFLYNLSTSITSLAGLTSLKYRGLSKKKKWHTHYMKFCFIERAYVNLLCGKLRGASWKSGRFYKQWFNFSLFSRDKRLFPRIKATKVFMSIISKKKPLRLFRSSSETKKCIAYNSVFRSLTKLYSSERFKYRQRYKTLVVKIHKRRISKKKKRLYNKYRVFHSFFNVIQYKKRKGFSIPLLKRVIRRETLNENFFKWEFVVRVVRLNSLPTYFNSKIQAEQSRWGKKKHYYFCAPT